MPSYHKHEAYAEDTYDKIDERTALLKIDQNDELSKASNKSRNFDHFVLVIVSVLISGFSFGFGNGLSVLYPEFVRVFHSERSLAALVQGLNVSLNISGSILWTKLVKLYGCGFCMKCGILVSVLAVFLGQFSVNIWMVIFFIGIVSGIGQSIVSIGALLLINNVLSDVPWKPAALSVVSVGSSLFQFVFTFLTELLIEQYGWQGAVMILSAVLAHMMILAIKLHAIEKLNSRTDEQHNIKIDIFTVNVLKNVRLYIYAINVFLIGCSAFIESRFLVDLIILKGFDRETGSQFVSYLAMANFCARIAGVVLKIFIPGKNLLQITLFLFLNGSTHAIILYFSTYTGLLLGAILNGFTYGLVVSQWTTAILEVFVEDFGAAMVALNVVGGVGSFCLSFFGGYIQDVTNSYDLLFELGILMTIIIVLLFLVLIVLSSESYKHVCKRS